MTIIPQRECFLYKYTWDSNTTDTGPISEFKVRSRDLGKLLEQAFAELS
jgi:hypothetical protein